MQCHVLIIQNITNTSTNTEYTFISAKQNKHNFLHVLPHHHTFFPRNTVFVMPGKCRALNRGEEMEKVIAITQYIIIYGGAAKNSA